MVVFLQYNEMTLQCTNAQTNFQNCACQKQIYLANGHMMAAESQLLNRNGGFLYSQTKL